jgi:hypothetical protein
MILAHSGLLLPQMGHGRTQSVTPTHSLPGWQGSTERYAAVGEYIAMAVRVIVVLSSFRRPRAFYLPDTH